MVTHSPSRQPQKSHNTTENVLWNNNTPQTFNRPPLKYRPYHITAPPTLIRYIIQSYDFIPHTYYNISMTCSRQVKNTFDNNTRDIPTTRSIKQLTFHTFSQLLEITKYIFPKRRTLEIWSSLIFT